MHVPAGFVVDHSRCTAIEENKTRINGDDNDAGEENAYPVISKTVLLENGRPKVFSDLVASLYREL